MELGKEQEIPTKLKKKGKNREKINLRTLNIQGL